MCVLLAEKLRWPKLRVFLAENVNEGHILVLLKRKRRFQRAAALRTALKDFRGIWRHVCFRHPDYLLIGAYRVSVMANPLANVTCHALSCRTEICFWPNCPCSLVTGHKKPLSLQLNRGVT